MSKYINDFDELTILNVISSYLYEGLSHRTIQREILGIPAPARGGGFIAMDILHHFNLKGDSKAILKKKSIQDIKTDENIELNNLLDKLEEMIKIALIVEENINKKYFKISGKTTSIKKETKVRVNQNILRKRVLENYDNKCALCEINMSDLLICSHIKPWSIDEDNRLNPKNAICLCTFHDSLFDKGYFGFDSNYNIITSKKCDNYISEKLKHSKFRAPKREKPDFKFLEYHLKNICNV